MSSSNATAIGSNTSAPKRLVAPAAIAITPATVSPTTSAGILASTTFNGSTSVGNTICLTRLALPDTQTVDLLRTSCSASQGTIAASTYAVYRRPLSFGPSRPRNNTVNAKTYTA